MSVRYVYHTTDCTFLQFLSAVIAEAAQRAAPEPIVLTMVEHLIDSHEHGDSYTHAMMAAVNKYTGGTCRLESH